jgi:hypothetical protein
MQYLECVDASATFAIRITLGKLYTEISNKPDAGMVGIIDDTGEEAEYYAYRFKRVTGTSLDKLKDFK